MTPVNQQSGGDSGPRGPSLWTVGFLVAVAVGSGAGWYGLRLADERARVALAPSTQGCNLAGSVNAVSSPNGMLRLLATPPGVSVTVDGDVRGVVQAEEGRPWRSRPFLLPGLSAGEHEVAIGHGSVRSDTVAIDVLPDVSVECRLSLWLPNAVVELTDGTSRMGMIRDESPAAICLAVSPSEDETIPKTKVRHRRMTRLIALRDGEGLTIREGETQTPELVVEPFPGKR